MRRRRLLGLLVASPTAGCLGTLGVPRATVAGVRPCDPPGDDTGPRAVCPGEEYDRIVWTGEAGPEAPVRMTAGRTTATLPVDGLGFTLHNESGGTVVTNPYGWRLWRWTGDGWRSATEGIIKLPALSLPHGGSYTWRLTATPGDPGGDRPERNGAKEEIRLSGLPPGTYAFGIGVDPGGDGDGGKLAAAVLLELRRER